MNKKVVGIILAGGKSKRFGTNKAFAQYKGKTFFQRAYEVLMDTTDDVIIVGNRSMKTELSHQIQSQIVTDFEEVKGLGPMAGLYTAMSYMNSSWYFVLPCDMPLISKSVVHTLLSHCHPGNDVIIPMIQGKVQPLVGLYHNRTKPLMLKHLQAKSLKMNDFLNEVNVKYVDEHHFEHIDHFINVNDLSTYQYLQNTTDKK
ncbi:molybdenum cofactor guanylyltransferase [Bacillus sp. FJAT-47783]|uniref:molybdenum cofactor guanylyltransferase n=1 Tax=Bacillus sp. FJAT-47783 TaxID=2922712 RepID=UPI001FAE5000